MGVHGGDNNSNKTPPPHPQVEEPRFLEKGLCWCVFLSAYPAWAIPAA